MTKQELVIHQAEFDFNGYTNHRFAKVSNYTVTTTSRDEELNRGKKYYELSNHLDNVLAVVSDRKVAVNTGSGGASYTGDNSNYDLVNGVYQQNIGNGLYTFNTPSDDVVDFYHADVVAANDYYPFGMIMPGRSYEKTGTDYRFGFNGMEQDDEVKGAGNSYDFGARIYDPRVGRWLSLDPLQAKYPGITPFHFCYSNPLVFKDPTGEDGEIIIKGNTITYRSTIWLYGPEASNVDIKWWNSKVKKLNPTREVYDEETEKTWIVKFDIKFAYDENMDEALEGHEYTTNSETFSESNIAPLNLADKIEGFQPGDNVLKIDKPEGFVAVSTTLRGWNNGKSTNNFNVAIHEVFHELGFDERSKAKGKFAEDHEGMYENEWNIGDVLTQGGRIKGAIYPIHFVDLLEFVKENKFKEGVYHLQQVDDTGHGHEPTSLEDLQKAEDNTKVIE